MISLYVVRKRLMSRMGSMLTIPSPPFGSSWHSLASIPHQRAAAREGEAASGYKLRSDAGIFIPPVPLSVPPCPRLHVPR